MLRASFERVLASGDCAPDLLLLQRYDIEVPGRAGEFAERYWSVASCPLQGRDGTVRGLVVRLQEVNRRLRGAEARQRRMAEELREMVRRQRTPCSR
ncbi:hypothetical protein [Nonomuraea rubra]|uniref:PAC domain-containing protein n=1 Tax=Nonomuraea rubra TaxID=46180 RepID=A0A7X0P2R9_9ACTN|nr:hypothetical protein [Nonomuraea rubra]MBB6554201.1 hypothetical protein [Nonomuraea rubra]